ncbi:PIG-L family deacetylase [Metabacillus halosaccharovorans]|uniref:PIG-L family deacetylase n=1 Tax=Metabacillus halosaccharovorans TaxID=930124 RepID=UPI002041953A|nr:PIG-L family deacetylase [Metabacillus halosaccharovorans]MCM3444723.1 PIG-L family deacetylase [Metabacillus halosaccharovorans]
MELFKQREIFVISPHIDDAFLSMGGLIHTLLDEGNTINIINIFSKTNFSVKHDNHNIIRIRKAEEMENINLIKKESNNQNCFIEFWDMPDALIRGHKVEGIFDYPKYSTFKKEDNIINKLEFKFSELIKSNLNSVFFIPLGIGNHIDHIIVRDTFNDVFSHIENQSDLIGYEEQPYSFLRTNYITVPVEREIIIPINMDIKKKLVKNYSSQILYVDDFLTSLEKYCNSLSSIPSERFIHIKFSNVLSNG